MSHIYFSMSLSASKLPIIDLNATDARFFDALYFALAPHERSNYPEIDALNQSQLTHRVQILSAQPIHTANVCFQLKAAGLSADVGLAPLWAATQDHISQAQTDIEHQTDALWLRLLPIHWSAGRDHVRLGTFYAGEPNHQDIQDWQAIWPSIQPWIEEFGWEVYPTSAQSEQPNQPRQPVIYLRTVNTFDYHAPDFELAQSDILEAFLPHGADLKRWQTLQTELQMLLHTHEVNQARLARGAQPINGFWLDQVTSARDIPAEILSHHDFFTQNIVPITYECSLNQIEQILTPVAEQLKQNKNAELVVLNNIFEGRNQAVAHHFAFRAPTLLEKIRQKITPTHRINADKIHAHPLGWLTQYCCEDEL